jgi:hypothetical protein
MRSDKKRRAKSEGLLYLNRQNIPELLFAEFPDSL